MPSPTDPLAEGPEPKYAAVVELMNKLQDKDVQENKNPKNRTEMKAKNGESFKFTG